MSELQVYAEARIDAPAEVTYRCIADYQQHQKFLPGAFSEFRIEQGGVGAGSVIAFKMTAGSRVREYRMKVEEPQPGRVLKESDLNSSLVTTFTVTPDGASACKVSIETRWQQRSKGIGMLMERIFAPGALKKLYQEELVLLNDYARKAAQQQGATA